MQNALSPIETGSLEPLESSSSMSVGELERRLMSLFPAEDACDWDRTGLLVGDASVKVLGVFVALDPTVSSMKQALSAGCNVLLTHHPVYLDAPVGFYPDGRKGETPGSRVAFALSHDLACMNFHTALDVSVEGLSVLPRMLRLRCLGPLEPLCEGSQRGFVMLADVDVPLSLDELALRCVSVNHEYPRVWGDGSQSVRRIAVSGGSANSFLKTCLSAKVDCLVCGEVGYHAALDASASGLAIIELGHDVSEMPLCAVLASAVSQVGVPDSCITMVPAEYAWHTPESYRR